MYVYFISVFFSLPFFRCKKDSMRWFTLVVPIHIHAKRQKLTKNMWNLSSLFYFILCFFLYPSFIFFSKRGWFSPKYEWADDTKAWCYFFYSLSRLKENTWQIFARAIFARFERFLLFYFIFSIIDVMITMATRRSYFFSDFCDNLCARSHLKNAVLLRLRIDNPPFQY